MFQNVMERHFFKSNVIDDLADAHIYEKQCVIVI